MTDKTATSIEVYWNEGWAYRAIDAAGRERSGRLDAAEGDLDDAIREACRLEGLDLTPDQFAREPSTEGGWAIYRGAATPARKTYTIRTDEGLMDETQAIDLADALDQFGAPAGVRDAASFAAWLEQAGGYGWIEEDGVRIVSVPA